MSKVYTESQKQQIIKEVSDTGNLSLVAEKHSIPKSTVGTWISNTKRKRSISGKIIREFSSIHEAARWLVDSGIAKNTNCASSISSVCLRKHCTTGYGFRKKAYGYDWRFTEDI